MPYWIIALIVFFVLDLIFVIIILVKRARGKVFSLKELQYIKSHWIRIIDTFSNNPQSAIMDADKLLYYALDRKGIEGTLGEKLKKAGLRFSDLNGVWKAHKLRNRVAHELSAELNVDEAKKALRQFKRALNDLGANL